MYGMYSNAVAMCLNNLMTDICKTASQLALKNINFRQNSKKHLD